MFIHACSENKSETLILFCGQTDIRAMAVTHWGSELGQEVMGNLSRLYTSLVWESTILLALCSEDVLPGQSKFGKLHCLLLCFQHCMILCCFFYVHVYKKSKCR